MNSIAKTLNFKKYTIYDTNDVLKFDYDVMFRSLLKKCFWEWEHALLLQWCQSRDYIFWIFILRYSVPHTGHLFLHT